MERAHEREGGVKMNTCVCVCVCVCVFFGILVMHKFMLNSSAELKCPITYLLYLECV